MTTTTLVLGIGNSLMRDDGVGVHVINRIAPRLAGRPGVDCLDGGTLSFTLAASIAEANGLIVIDAARFGASPGTVRVFEGEEMDAFVSAPGRRSAHEVGLRDLLWVSYLEDSYPARRALIGIEPEDTGLGEHPTPAVERAITAACDHIETLLEAWSA